MGRRLGKREVARRMTASKRQALAVDYYVQGWSMRRIAAELNYAGPSGVKKAIEGAIAKAPSRAVNELRIELDERSRLLLEQLMPIVVNSRTKREDRFYAIDRVIKIDRELREMYGVDAPAASVQLTGEISVKDVRQKLLDRLDALAEQTGARAVDPELVSGGEPGVPPHVEVLGSP